ncbi:MAG: hypothetical protein ABI026_08895, partial [Gemmatimonadaceae bacterium]
AMLAICIANAQDRRIARADSVRPEAVLLEVRIGDVASATLQAVRLGDAVRLPLAELLALAGLPARREAVGYVSEDSLTAILHAPVTVDWDDLTATIADDGTLPVSRALAREQRRVDFQRAKEHAIAPIPITVGIPALPRDVVVNYDVMSTADHARQTTSIRAAVGSSVLGGALEFGVLKAPGVVQNSLTWERSFPDRLPVRSMRVGSVPLGEAGLGTGFMLSSQIPNQMGAIEPIVLKGSSGSGWQIEVYRDNDLVYAGLADSAGRYAARVPASRGVNRFTVSVYGPDGEWHTRNHYISVGGDALRRGTGFYNIAVGKCASVVCDSAAQLDARYSPVSGITFGGALSDEVTGKDHHFQNTAILFVQPRDDLDAEIQSAANQLGVQAHYAPGPAFDLAASYRGIPPVHGYRRAGAPLAATTVNASWRSQRSWFMSASADFTDRDFAGRQRLRIATSVSVVGAYLHPSVIFARRPNAACPTMQYGVYSESGMPAMFPAGSRLRIGIADEPYADSFAELALPVTSAAQLQIGANWAPGQRTPGLTLAMGMISRASRFDVRDIASQIGHTLTSSISGSATIGLGATHGSPRVSLSPFQQLGSAQIAGIIFMDDNGNGIHDVGEPGIPTVSLVVGDMSVDTDSSGTYRVLGLTPFVPLTIAVDSLTLPDESMVAPSVRVTPPANGTTRVDIPVTSAPSPSGPVHFVHGVSRVAQHAQRCDSAAIHRDNFESRTGYSNPVAHPWQSAESSEHVSPQCRPVSIGNVEIVIIPCVDQRQCTGQLEYPVHFERRPGGHVVLIRDVAHYFLDKVLDRNDASRAAVLVDHDRHVRPRPSQVIKDPLRRSAIRNVQSLTHQFRQVECRARLSQPQILGEKYADDIVQCFTIERIA